MRSDFDLIVHDLPAAPEYRLYFIGDLHVGAIECNRRAWEDFCGKLLSDENARICIFGDLLDNGTKQSVTNCFEASMRPRDQKKYLMNSLAPLSERILCFVRGNHEYRNRDVDDDPLYDIACKLDLEDLYRPNAAFVKLSIGKRNHGHGTEKAIQVYTLAVLHGTGGGIYTGAAVNRNERFATSVLEGVDVLAVGHTHKGVISKPSKIVVDCFHNSVTQKSMTVISACSWLSYGGYALNKMLLPSQAQDPEQPQTVLLGGLRDKRYIKTIW